MPSLIPEDLTRPGTHALVIGVSRYLHFADGADPTPRGTAFQMEQLSAAARSASEFAAWLLRDYRCLRAPLKSLRVLLSQSATEAISPDVGALLKGDNSATLPNVHNALGEFRNACNAWPRDNVAIVYVAGHGVQLSKHGAVLLLSDLGDPAHLGLLEGAVDMAGVHAGMRHPGTAQTQFWFVDACRQKPDIAKRFERLGGALTLDVPNGDAETSPMFLAATTGTAAYARVDDVTLFNEALLWALRGGAATGPEAGVDCWHVPVTALISRLPERVKALAMRAGVEQSVDIAGKIHEAVLHELPAPPKVDLRIDVRPEAARLVSRGTLKQNADAVVVQDFAAWPLQRQVDAGLYLMSVESSAPFVGRNKLLNVKPPTETTEVSVSP
jgi:hypothetical protein